ncbi:ATP-binding cassette domain-containing protein [Peribacillus frigoritolerans]|nr:ATP-binding cassette domain-containing protein [Peribacillus frigoritolerans]
MFARESGCGKTTLLKLVAGLLKVDTGVISLNGNVVIKPSPEAGFVFQSPTLLEWKTVMDNVLLPVSLRGKVTVKDIEYAMKLLETVGLADYLQSFPAQLSGGQQSRVAIARALIEKPSMMFFRRTLCRIGRDYKRRITGRPFKDMQTAKYDSPFYNT